MPNMYEGEAVAVVRHKLSEDDYARASWQMKRTLFPMCRPVVRVGLCLSGAVAFALMIPYVEARFSTFLAPACGILLCFALCVWFLLFEPKYDLLRGAQVYRSNRLFALETTVSVYRDSVRVENEYEKFLEYWTDFSACLESEDYIIVCGGRERDLLIFVKAALSSETVANISSKLMDHFAGRYRKLAGSAR